MLNTADKLFLKDNYEYQAITGRGEERGEITYSLKKVIKGTVILRSARQQNENGGFNVAVVKTFKTNVSLPANARFNRLGDETIKYKIITCIKQPSLISRLYEYQIDRV